jgi:hypothetical protein
MLVMMLELLELLKVTIAVGGVREVYLGTQDDADVLYLKKR